MRALALAKALKYKSYTVLNPSIVNIKLIHNKQSLNSVLVNLKYYKFKNLLSWKISLQKKKKKI